MRDYNNSQKVIGEILRISVCFKFMNGLDSTPKHWAAYEQLRRKMEIMRVVSVELKSHEQVKISNIPYHF